MRIASFSRSALLLVFAVAGSLWAYPVNFATDPTDPLYPKTANSQGCSQVGAPTCIDPPGQWDMYSYSPTVPATAHPSGISADLAWKVTAGRPDVEIAVFDSGVNYDHEDLRNKIWLNRGELPVPSPCPPHSTPDPYDCDGDGVFSVKDYTGDSRITPIVPGKLSRRDLRVFEDGIDGDGNGYIDDISGFDFDDDDGDEYDHRDFGHGTGRNGIAAAEANNGVGISGTCPNCRLANARIEDTYVVVRAETTANACVWAADHHFEVINMALGHVGASSMSRRAFDYAYSRNVLPMSAIANEFHFHQGYVGLYDNVMAIGALAYAGPTTAGIAPNNGQPTQAPTTYLRKAGYSNYGAHLTVVAPSDTLTTNMAGAYADSSGTSSATPHAAGVAGLVYSEARNVIDVGTLLNTTGLVLKDISNLEVRQVIIQTADDIKPSDDPAPGTYPVSVGWDKWTGYGRINAKKAVDLVAAGKIPPEADIDSPDWYTYVDGTVPVKFYANNRWRGSYNWVLEYGVGVEPATFTAIQSGSGTADKTLASTLLADNYTVAWNTTGLTAGGYTLRLRVSDAVDASIKGEDRMYFFVRRGLIDPDDHPGFPIRVTRTFGKYDALTGTVGSDTIPISTESMSNALVDLDGDNRMELILADADGEVRVYRADGTPDTAFGNNGVVQTDPLPGLPGRASPAFDGDFSNGEVPVTGASIIGGVAVGDIDADGSQDICAAAVNGKVYCWNAAGQLKAGFPVSTDLPKQFDQYTRALTTQSLKQGEAIVAPPTLRNIDGDAAGTLEIAVASRDQKLYVWKADGSRLVGFPVALGTAAIKDPAGTISGVLVADIDLDGKMDLLVGTNEVAGSLPNTNGFIYAFNRDGTAKAGWPVKPASPAAGGVPIVAAGVVNGPLAANLDTTDAALEVVGHAFLGDATIYKANGMQLRTLNGNHSGSGTAPDTLEETPTGGPARPDDVPVHTYTGLGAIADFNPTVPGLEYLDGTIGNNLVVNVAAGSGAVTSFDHYFSAWNANTGNHLPNFPRIVDGWQFVTGPAVADLDNANGPEAVVTNSGLFVHAFNNSSGTNIAGWPKFVGHWQVNTPTIGDMDDDGKLEVIVSDRLGYVHAWNTKGSTCSGSAANAQWRKYRHDEWNTGDFTADTVRPAKVSDLALSQVGDNVQATFTAVGNDGRCGTAARYAVVSNGAAVAGLPAPKAAGMAETLLFPGNASAPFTLRVVDAAGNASPPVVLNEGGGGGGGSGPMAPVVLAVLTLAFGLRRRFRANMRPANPRERP